MLAYTRNALNSLKVINSTSHGSLPRPLSSELVIFWPQQQGKEAVTIDEGAVVQL